MPVSEKKRGAGPLRRGIAALCLVAGLAGAAPALDFNDVLQLMRHDVSENVIVAMANADASLFITYEEADQLRGMGASENLVQALRPRPVTVPADSAASPAAAPQSVVIQERSPSVVYDSSGKAYVETESGVYVEASPPVVYVQPQPVPVSPPKVYSIVPNPGVSIYFGAGPRWWGPGPRWGHHPPPHFRRHGPGGPPPGIPFGVRPPRRR